MYPVYVKKSNLRALKYTIVAVSIISIVLVWLGHALARTIEGLLQSPILPQLLVSFMLGILILFIATPQLIPIIKRYTSSVRKDVQRVSELYRGWVREMEFIQLSREALKAQEEFAKKVSIYE